MRPISTTAHTVPHTCRFHAQDPPPLTMTMPDLLMLIRLVHVCPPGVETVPGHYTNRLAVAKSRMSMMALGSPLPRTDLYSDWQRNNGVRTRSVRHTGATASSWLSITAHHNALTVPYTRTERGRRPPSTNQSVPGCVTAIRSYDLGLT